MNDNRFRLGVTDQGPPRAAKGGFPYPGHGPLPSRRADWERAQAKQQALYERYRKSWRTA